MLESIEVPLEKLKFVKGTEYQLSRFVCCQNELFRFYNSLMEIDVCYEKVTKKFVNVFLLNYIK